ncbi:hypothetical protein K0M31_018650 [Melipona bicolor]|uniref:Uncharacterized protein n=1 Tax=Melipona bicolor TaxID=60889 RepID=A0AA40KRW6_9HYME|nr:hypothetical protein K0M31_018650 [Melipona bicolor]
MFAKGKTWSTLIETNPSLCEVESYVRTMDQLKIQTQEERRRIERVLGKSRSFLFYQATYRLGKKEGKEEEEKVKEDQRCLFLRSVREGHEGLKRSWKRHERVTCDGGKRMAERGGRLTAASGCGPRMRNFIMYAVICVTSHRVDLHANSSASWPARYAFRLIPVVISVGVISR